MKELTGTNREELYEHFYAKNAEELKQIISNLSNDKGKLYGKACEAIRAWLHLRYEFSNLPKCNECGKLYEIIAAMPNEQMIKVFLPLTDLL